MHGRGEQIAPDIVVSETTLFDILRDIWSAKVTLLICAILMTGFAFLFITFANTHYKAQMILAPANPMGQETQASTSEGTIQVQQEQLQSTAAFMRFETIYQGVTVASVLLKDQEIQDALMFDRPFEFSQTQTEWTPETFSEYIQKRMRLEPLRGSALRRMTYAHPNKEFAKYMITRIHRISDEIIRRQILQETNGRIGYLNKAMERTVNPEHRRNMTELLMEQERLKMLVSLDQPFAASIIERAFVSAKPYWPDPYVIYPVFIAIGLFLGYLIHGFREKT